MIKNLEFIKNRSFEIAWAVFRCATLVKNEDLKKELESASIKLAAKYGNSDSLKKSSSLLVEEEISEVEKLISLIRLAEAIGEIKIINARVLYRELSNISEAVKEAEQALAEALVVKPQEEIFIQGIFSAKPEILKEFGRQLDFNESVAKSGNGLTGLTKGSLAKFGNSSARLTTGNVAKSVAKDEASVAKKEVSPEKSGNDLNNQAKNLAKSLTNNSATFQKTKDLQGKSVAKSGNGLTRNTTGNVAKNESMPTGRQASVAMVRQSSPQVAELMNSEELVPESWEDLIYRKIKEISKASSREISAFFPEISERTIRFYLQRLSDLNLIERVGISGPGSYYILKKA